MLLLLQFLVFFLLHFHNFISSPHPDHITLLSIKSSISFPTKNSTFSLWTITKPHCTFPYVKCDPSSNHIISLNLSSLSLTGPIPPQISNLSHLTYLNLSHNIFNSTFPTQLYLLKRLQTLSVYDNNLTGHIPSKPHLFPYLRYLNLAGNYFTGEIPKKIGFLSKLEYLDLAGNELTGPIPGEIGKLGNLKELRLGYFNAFTGGLPKEIGNLSNLVSLDAGYCNLTGEIPVEFGRLRNLDSVYLEVNGLRGSLRVFGELKKLKSLDLSNNVFTGEIPREFSGLRDLRLLNLFRNRLTGEIPGFIGKFPRLEVFQLWENDFTGEIPRGLGSNGRLKWFDVSTNRLTGTLPVDLCKGNSLTALITMRNGLVGEIPESLARCRSLNRLRMGQNRLNGSIPKGLFSLPGLKLVELPNNLLSGVFPDGDGLLTTSLEQITLCNNQLTGELPPTIGNFVGVQELLLDGNKFLGRIPSEIGKLQKLSKMDLSRNEFSGAIAPEISRCERLTFVDLSQNQLSGNIPMEIADLKILNYLNLSRNHLIGNIPPSMGSMLSLTSVDFSYNNLSGLVPETGQLSYFNSPSFMGNPNLCGASLGACKRGIANGGEGPHEKGVFSPLMKLLIVIGLLVCSIVFAIATIMKARALKKSSKACSWKLTTFQRLGFTCDDVLDCLKEDNIIGKGGAGIVYRGVMPNTESVAVKMLSVVSRGSSHDHGFNAEIQTLGSIRHRHIVKLLGFCSNYDTNLLIYEYMPNGSLGEMLHGEKGAHLHWEARYKIAVEAAKGLCYLHHDCSPLIVHRDIKSSNILLDSNFEAHVADFGLAKFLQNSDTSECMSAIAGSYGYIAPEYVYTLNVNEKSDVYSFGVVLLELVAGKRPVGEFGDGVDLVQWIRKMTGGKKERVVEIIDPRISKIPLHDITHVFYVAMLCVEEQAIERPTMREVVHMLTELPTSPSSMRGDSPPPSSDLESPRTYASGCSPLLDLSV